MKKLYWILCLFPVVCYASPTKNLEKEIIALQQKFDDIDKKMSMLIEKINAQDVLLAQQTRTAQAAIATTCNAEQSDGLQTIVEESESIETTEDTIQDAPVKKLKLSWGKRIAPKEKNVKKEVVKKTTTKEIVLTQEQIADALDTQGDN